ncbi:MAG: hypothetical protein V5A68_03575 [Candidatus Thermoplasmatota archaeon]
MIKNIGLTMAESEEKTEEEVKKHIEKEKESHTSEASLMLFLIVYSAFMIILSQFYINISHQQGQFNIYITNWFFLAFLIAILAIRIAWYLYVKGQDIEREERGKKVEKQIKESQEQMSEEDENEEIEKQE